MVEEEGDRAIHPQDKEGVFVVEEEEESNAIHPQDEGGIVVVEEKKENNTLHRNRKIIILSPFPGVHQVLQCLQ